MRRGSGSKVLRTVQAPQFVELLVTCPKRSDSELPIKPVLVQSGEEGRPGLAICQSGQMPKWPLHLPVKWLDLCLPEPQFWLCRPLGMGRDYSTHCSTSPFIPSSHASRPPSSSSYDWPSVRERPTTPGPFHWAADG